VIEPDDLPDFNNPSPRHFVRAEAEKQGVDPDLAERVLMQESGGRVKAVSPKGARGPMQLMPGTAKQLGVNANDPYDNIRGGVAYLKQNINEFHDPKLAVAAYNAGPGAVRKAGYQVPQIKETRQYVKAVAGDNLPDFSNDGLPDFGGNSMPTAKPVTRQPLAWNQGGDTSPIKHAPRTAVGLGAMANGDEGLAQQGAGFHPKKITPTDTFASEPTAGQIVMGQRPVVEMPDTQPEPPITPLFQPRYHNQPRRAPRSQPNLPMRSVTIGPGDPAYGTPRDIQYAPDAPGTIPTSQLVPESEARKAQGRRMYREELKRANQSGFLPAQAANAVTGLAKVGANAVSAAGRFLDIDALKNAGDETREKAEDYRAAQGDESTVGNIVHGAAQFAPAVVVPGGFAGFGTFEASQAYGEGRHPAEAIIKRGIPAAATAKLGGELASRFQRTAAGPVESYLERAAGNLAAPVVVRAATGGGVDVTPEDVGFALAFGVPGGGEQAARRAEAIRPAPTASQAPSRPGIGRRAESTFAFHNGQSRVLAAPNAEGRPITSVEATGETVPVRKRFGTARNEYEAQKAAEESAPLYPRVKVAPTEKGVESAISTQLGARQPLPSPRLVQRAGRQAPLESPARTAPTSPAPSQAAQRGDFETMQNDTVSRIAHLVGATPSSASIFAPFSDTDEVTSYTETLPRHQQDAYHDALSGWESEVGGPQQRWLETPTDSDEHWDALEDLVKGRIDFANRYFNRQVAPESLPITPRAEARLADTPDGRGRVAVPQAPAADVGEGQIAPTYAVGDHLKSPTGKTFRVEAVSGDQTHVRAINRNGKPTGRTISLRPDDVAQFEQAETKPVTVRAVSGPRTVNPETHSLTDAISILGFDGTTQDGKDLAAYVQKRPGTINNTRLANGEKRGLDNYLIPALQDLGYDVADANDLLDKVTSQKPVYSQHYYEAQGEREIDRHLAAEHQAWLDEKPDSQGHSESDILFRAGKSPEFVGLLNRLHDPDATAEDEARFYEEATQHQKLPDDLATQLIETATSKRTQQGINQHDVRDVAQSAVKQGESSQRPPQRGAVRDAAAKEGDVNGKVSVNNRAVSGLESASSRNDSERMGTRPSTDIEIRDTRANGHTQSDLSTDHLSRVQSIFDALKDESRTTGRRLTDLVEDRINQQPLPGMEAQGLSESDATLLRQMATRAPNRAPVSEKQEGLLDVAPTLESKQAQTAAIEEAQSRGAANAPLFEGKGERDNIESMNRPQKPGVVEQEEGGTGKEAQPQAAARSLKDPEFKRVVDRFRDPEGNLHIRIAEDNPVGKSSVKDWGFAENLVEMADSYKDAVRALHEHYDPDLFDIDYPKIRAYFKNQQNDASGIVNPIEGPLVTYPSGVSTFRADSIESWHEGYRQELTRMGFGIDPSNPNLAHLKVWLVKGNELGAFHPDLVSSEGERIIAADEAKDITAEVAPLFRPAKLGPSSSESTQTAEVPSDIHHSNFQPRDTDSGQFVEGAPEYVKPSSVDTVHRADLEGALKLKAEAWTKVKEIRERLKNEPLGGNRSALRLQLMKWQDTHGKALESERQARQAIEARAGELNQTTVKPTPDVVDKPKVEAFHRQLLESGKSVDQYLSQPELFGDELTPGERDHLRELGEPARQAIAEHGQFARFLFHASERGKGDAFLGDPAVKRALNLPDSANLTTVHNRLRAELGMETNKKVSPETLYGWAANKNLPHEAVEKIKRAEDGAIQQAERIEQRRKTEGGFLRFGGKPATPEQEVLFDDVNQTVPDKTEARSITDFIIKARRAMLLSSVKTIGKLGAAATGRIGITPIEEATGAMLGKIPGISRIAAKAPREGGFSGKAEGAALNATFSKQTLADMKATAKTGVSSIDTQYGGKTPDTSPEAIEFFGRVHGALKTPAKRNEFYRSLEKRTAFALQEARRNGVTDAQEYIQRPDVQAMLSAKAYEDAQRAIFMNDNGMVEAYKMLRNYAESRGALGRSTSKAMQFFLPVVKVPTNYVIESSSYGIGAAKALGQVISAKGIENLTPDQADYVMRNLKKQSIGVAMMAIGYFGASAVGGYYQEGDKRARGEPEAGGFQVFGVDVPKFLLHTPALEALQIGATLRRVSDKQESFGAGAAAAGKGLVSEIPFFDEPARLAKALKDSTSAAKFAGETVRSMIVPPDVQNVARMTDTENGERVQRHPQGFVDTIKVGIPGLRQQVEGAVPVQRTPGESAVHTRATANFKPDSKPFTDADRDRSKAKRELVDLIRAGKMTEAESKAKAMLDAGQVSQKELTLVGKRAQMGNDLKYDMSRLSVTDALDLYESGPLSTEEKKQVSGVILDKLMRLDPANVRGADLSKLKGRALKFAKENLDLFPPDQRAAIQQQ
jgi:hypothetical protein